jgi:hypothetical protein
MRIAVYQFETYAEAETAREEFPLCAGCKGGLKIQAMLGSFFLQCMRNRAHRGIRKGDIND